MMKKSAIVFILLALAALSVQAQHILPSSVRQYLNERALGEQETAVSQFAHSRIVDGTEMIDCFIAIDNEGVIPKLKLAHVIVSCQFDGFVTAMVPVDRLAQVSQITGVNNVEISPKLKLCTDSTMRATHVIDVLSNGTANGLPLNYDGSGVIVGIIDVGFDYCHKAFRRADDPSHSRIVRVYDTMDKTGHQVWNKQSVLSGSVFIDDEVLSLTTDDESSSHGTHTSSIAAGTHVNGYGGMAPGADIVLCAVTQMGTGLSAVEVANCIRYINCYADSVGKPFVVSVSVSTSTGPHDGKDYLSKAIAQVMGPGKIFVIAAGNNGSNPTYAHRYATPTEPIHFLIKQKDGSGYDSSYHYSDVVADIWMRNEFTRYDYKFHVLDLNTNQIVWESEESVKDLEVDLSQLSDYYKATGNGSSSYLKGSTGTSTDGKKYHLNLHVRNLESTEYTLSANGKTKYSRYALGLTITPRKETHVDAWVSNSNARFAQYANPVTTMTGEVVNDFYSASNSDCSIGTYAVHDSIISAGAYAARNSYYSLQNDKVVTTSSVTIGQITDFSSYALAGTGPTGKALPTICAPGYSVVAAGNRYNSYAANSAYTVMRTDDGSPWCVMGGTSMAAPTVAGIIALWLQANPKLSVRQVKDIIAETAIRDKYTNGSKGTHFGPNGKIDALAGIRLILKNQSYASGDVNCDGLVDINDLTTLIDFLLGARPEPFNASAADVDVDGTISINDLATLIDRVLNSN
jgi:hypothetical protein